MIKRILIIGASLIASYVMVAVGKLQEHPVLMYIGIGLACALVLGLLVWIFKLLCKFISSSLTSIIYVIAALATVGILSWFGKINASISFTAGMVLGAILLWLLFRKLGERAQSSLLIGEIFSFISSYKIRAYLTGHSIIDRATQITYNLDFKNITLVLKEQMGYSTKEAKAAATYAIEQTQPEAPLEDKIRKALTYQNDILIYKANNN